ncbi:MAG: iron-sulfur cluster assembly protein [Deltaproteobacteria bacterium]|jgi:metal-sulfur cluster biosynthetic enzyme|nr:iron-sulfur cluster assembly protein [Deltaproteobacteria bacterium]
MAKFNEDDVLEKLKNIIDPELEVNIVDLGLVYKINLNENGNIVLDMTLTAKGCPISNVIKYEVEEALKSIPGVNGVKVNFVWEPEWNPSMIKSDALKRLKTH